MLSQRPLSLLSVSSNSSSQKSPAHLPQQGEACFQSRGSLDKPQGQRQLGIWPLGPYLVCTSQTDHRPSVMCRSPLLKLLWPEDRPVSGPVSLASQALQCTLSFQSQSTLPVQVCTHTCTRLGWSYKLALCIHPAGLAQLLHYYSSLKETLLCCILTASAMCSLYCGQGLCNMHATKYDKTCVTRRLQGAM